MANEKRAYTIVFDDICERFGTDAAVICGKVATMCGEDNKPCEIRRDYLCKLIHKDKRTLRALLMALRQVGYIEFKDGNGRGHITTFKRGTNLLPFLEDKGVQICTIKGYKNAPHYNIKDNIGGRCACAHAPEPSLPGDFDKEAQGDTPCNPRKVSKNMNDSNTYPFEMFVKAFKPADEFKHELESCERQWATMSDLLREDVLKTLRSRKRHKPNPHWFLFDYKPTSLRLQPRGTVVRHDDYYNFYGDDLPHDGYKFVKPEGYDVFVFVKQ